MNRTSARNLLLALEPATEREAGFKRDMLSLLDVPGDPFARSHFVPGHFTASSFVLSPSGDSVLLIHHSKLHRWLQPGGHVDAEDTDLLESARREVTEETSLRAFETLLDGQLLDVDIHEIPPLKGEPGHKHFDVRFLFRAVDDAIAAGSDASDARWVKLEDVNAEASDESVMRAIRKIRATT